MNTKTVNTKSMVPPSAFADSVEFVQLGKVYAFRFNDELMVRFDELLSKQSDRVLTPDEQAELDGVLELLNIMVCFNHQLAAHTKQISNPVDAVEETGEKVDRITGLFADEPEAMQQIMDWIEQDRELDRQRSLE